MEQTDVVVIGSGYGGSIPAARLAAAGMSVVVLERGERLTSSDFQQSDDPRYITRIVDAFVSSSNLMFRTGKLVGGASIPMDGAHYRLPTKSFDVTSGTGRRYWPAAYSRSTMDPYYTMAEQMIGIRQLSWNDISRSGGLFAKMLDAAGASGDRALLNYRDCLQCGYCAQGCIFNKKNNLLHNYIPFAEQHGAEFRTGCVVDHLEPSGTGYLVSYARDGQPAQIQGQRVFVAGGGIHSPALLLRSASYLPNLSAQVGKNFNTNGEHGFIGFLPPEFDDLSRYWAYKGMDNAGVMSFHWYDEEGFTLHPGGGFEPTVFAGDFSAPSHPVLPRRAWGVEYKRFVEKMYPHRLIGFSSLGLADGHRFVKLGTGGTDVGEGDRSTYDAYLDRLEAIVVEVGRKSGITIVPAVPRKLAGMTSAHLLSSCRMAESPEDGVVDPNGQVHGHENLYLCDASAIPYALAVNPALTISAVAERVAAGVIARG